MENEETLTHLTTVNFCCFWHAQATALNAAQVAQSSLAANTILTMVWPETKLSCTGQFRINTEIILLNTTE